MRLLANENIPGETIDALRQAGYDVLWIGTESPGIDDRTVLARAQDESRILLTFDKDFGELAFRYGLMARSGIILLRLSAPSSAEVTQSILAILGSRDDWAGHFSVIDDPAAETKSLTYFCRPTNAGRRLAPNPTLTVD